VVTLYVNGENKATSAGIVGIGSVDNGQAFAIGDRNDTGYHAYFDGVIDELRMYGRALSVAEITQLYGQGLGNTAFGPNPADGATGVNPDTFLSWSPGNEAATHDVYFGTNETDVNDADTSSPQYMGKQVVDTWDPCGLESETTYYWRIDEVNGPNTWKGDVWGFTTWLDLISHWKLDEGSGSTTYDSVGDNDGTIYGATWTSGQIEGALSFDGVDDYVDIGDKASLDFGMDDFTLSAWIKTSMSAGGTIINKRAKGYYAGYDLYIQDGKIFARIADGS
jgi:hypothetical protein